MNNPKAIEWDLSFNGDMEFSRYALVPIQQVFDYARNGWEQTTILATSFYGVMANLEPAAVYHPMALRPKKSEAA